MGIIDKIARAPAEIERSRSQEFAKLGLFLLRSRGRYVEALDRAKKAGATDRVTEILQTKAATAGGIGTDDTSALASYKLLSQSFVATLSAFGAVDKILADGGFFELPMMTRVAIAAVSDASTALVDEAAAKPVIDVSFSAGQLSPKKIAKILTFTDELVHSAQPAAFAAISNTLRRKIAQATDSAFFADVALGSFSSSVASSGTTGAAFAADIDSALEMLTLASDSKIYLCASPNIITKLALARGTGGSVMFPDVKIGSPGMLSGIITLPSSGLDSEIVILDASQVAFDGSSPIVLDAANQATLDMTGGDTPAFSLWQKNSQALRCERRLAWEPLRSGCIVTITSVTA